MSAWIKGFVGIALLAAIYCYGVSDRGVTAADAPKDEFLAQLKAASDEMNATLPKMMGDHLRLDNTLASDKTFRYNYTLTNHTKDSLPTDRFAEVVTPELIRTACADKDMNTFMKHGVTVVFGYSGNDGKEISTIRIAPSKCAA